MSRSITLSWPTALLVAALLAAGIVGEAARAATSWAETLAAQALKQGPSTQLPPHLSAVLGLSSDGPGLAVRQMVFRDGFTVHTFNVGAPAPHRMVVTVVDEAAKSTVVYLLTPHGNLQRALQYHHGEAPQDVPVALAQPGFKAEVRLWSGMAGASGRAPASTPAPAH